MRAFYRLPALILTCFRKSADLLRRSAEPAILLGIASLFLLALGFIVLSGVLAMTDAALLSISFAEVEELVAQKKSGALALRKVTRKLTRTVVVIVIFTNTVTILGPILIGEAAVRLYGSASIGFVTAALTLVSILFSEIFPKAIGSHYAQTIGRIVAPVILFFTAALFPVVYVLEKLVSLVKLGKRRIGTEEQIRALARIGGGAGHIRQSEGELIHRVFILNDRKARDLMTPRRKVVALRSTLRVLDAIREVAKHPHSRYPVYDRTLDRVRGLVMNHDLYDAVSKGKEKQPVETVVREILFVPGSMRSDALLTLFRRRHIHLAVVQEGEKTVGIVSLEDVLEELVGEIEDERDAGKILS
jgi:putative hemolysin